MKPVLAIFLLWFTGLAAPAQPARPDKTVDSLVALLAMPRGTASRALPLKIKGVVSWLNPGSGFFLTDGPDATYVSLAPGVAAGTLLNPPPGLAPGAVVEIEGITQAGHYAPMVGARRIRLVGNVPPPVPRRMELDFLTAGREDCQLIEIEGVVQAVNPAAEGQNSDLHFSMKGGLGLVQVPGPAKAQDLESLVDARIRVRGILAVLGNLRGEMTGFRLLTLGRRDIEILTPAPPDPFAAPRVDPNQLNPFRPSGDPLHRIVTEGTVTYQKPGSYLIIQDGYTGLRIGTRTAEIFHPGDRVQVSGFLEMLRPVAGLTEAIVQRTGTAPLPAPLVSSLQKILETQDFALRPIRPATDCDNRLVTVQAVLREIQPHGDMAQLVLESEGTLFTATLPATGPDAQALTRWTRDSLVEFTGVCALEYSGRFPAISWPRATGLSLLGRSAEDVRVLRAASWWTRERLLIAAGAGAALLVLTLLWNAALRRRVLAKSRALAVVLREQHDAEREFEAERRERRRLAADLHDLISQGLAAAGMQLDAARLQESRNPALAESHRTAAREQLARCSADVRRSLAGLHADALEGRTFRQALESLARRLTQGTPVKCHVYCPEEFTPPLPDFIAGNLLILVQEALSNSLRHAGASTVHLTCSPDQGGAILQIQDNGCGFNPEAPVPAQEDHLGLRTMQERAQRLRGTLTVQSAPGQGTTLTVRIPASAIALADQLAGS